MGKRADVREAENRPAARTAEIDTEHVLISAAADQSIRWQPGERLDQLFEERCLRLREAGQAERLAVDAGDLTLSYDELDSRANQLARHLRLRGALPGDRIALLFDQPIYSYIAMLAVLKIHAAYVPLDIGFPLDRLSYIVKDSGTSLVLALQGLRDRIPDFPVPCLYLDEEQDGIGEHESGQLSARRRDPAPTSSRTSSTPRVRPAGPRALRSIRRESATSFGLLRMSTESVVMTGCTRA